MVAQVGSDRFTSQPAIAQPLHHVGRRNESTLDERAGRVEWSRERIDLHGERGREVGRGRGWGSEIETTG